ncbi:hypothetical protein [Sutcliffiella rhizosphaerae]|uniref:Tetratricopeptide repeat protein n=1 Tax=Sutcliffiella rhizosphaerae TaxID=2880967 RepID=A0ABM8YQM5_9BACI|nr:hypothetical protein [Sutcliffiella rhizosphaerae]CAG9622311.1 hypothetical protein BACCIP111883_03102 [Sutcliffiella rhizosphaerae]
MEHPLESLIITGRFSEAKDIFHNMTEEESFDKLVEFTFDTLSITNYSFVVSLLSENENEQLHDLAYLLLSQPLCHIEGAYQSALHHAKKAAELTDYQDVGFMENLLFLHSVPDKVLRDAEAKEIATKILAIDPKNQVAKQTMKELIK